MLTKDWGQAGRDWVSQTFSLFLRSKITPVKPNQPSLRCFHNSRCNRLSFRRWNYKTRPYPQPPRLPPEPIGSIHPDQNRVTLGGATANARNSQSTPAPLQFVNQGEEDPGTTSSQGMTQCDRTSVHIHLLFVPTEDLTIRQATAANASFTSNRSIYPG